MIEKKETIVDKCYTCKLYKWNKKNKEYRCKHDDYNFHEGSFTNCEFFKPMKNKGE